VTARPEASALRDFLARARRRVALLTALEGAAVGLAIALLAALLGIPRRGALLPSIAVGAALATLGAAIRVLYTRARRESVAALVERKAPHCRNVVVTAAELPGQRVTERVESVVYARAMQIIRSLELSALFPARVPVAAFGVAAVVWTLIIARAAGAPAAPASPAALSGTPSIERIDVAIVPPTYTKRATQTLHDPARIQALAGSELRFTIRARATRLAVVTLTSTDTLAASNDGTFTWAIPATADGYVALEPLGASSGVRRLVGLSVDDDERPRVRITAPARDLYFKDGSAAIDLAIESTDDIALASLTLRYTKVSGSGERFTFTEGEAPIAVTRTDARKWAARAQWRLAPLELGAGDMVVYRAVATDERPGATPSESDSYIAEVLAPGGVAAAGFALDPEQERYAVSQQMVILKTERLSARRSAPQDSIASAAAEIAAEQRKVRAEFVFMMGGELGEATDDAQDLSELNEEAEAEGEADLAAGRNLNLGRIALLRAIRSMSRAAQSLTNADLATALTHERAALVQLERAFSRTRILLRALTLRERLDMTRRLTGTLTDASRDVRPRAEPEPDPKLAALRRAVANIATLAGSPSWNAVEAQNIGEEILRADASSKPLQEAAALLASASSSMAKKNENEARSFLDRAATRIAAVIRVDLAPAPRISASSLDRLGGALGDALRRGGAR
jgi:hypothetical protein